MHLVETDEVDARAAQIPHHTGEEARRHFEEMVGLKTPGPRRTNVVQRQNGADALDERPKRNVRAGEIQRFQAAANDRLF